MILHTASNTVAIHYMKISGRSMVNLSAVWSSQFSQLTMSLNC